MTACLHIEGDKILAKLLAKQEVHTSCTYNIQ